MWTSPRARVVLLALAAGMLAAAATFGWSAPVATAAPAGDAGGRLPSGGCLLGLLCPPTTTVPRTVTTVAPPTSAPPTTAHTTTTARKATTTTASSRPATGTPSVGVAGLPLTGSVNLPALGTTDPPAPQLAGSAAATTTTNAAAFVAPSLPSAVLATSVPDNHATLRILFSVAALIIAAVALAQLPAARRSPRSAMAAETRTSSGDGSGK